MRKAAKIFAWVLAVLTAAPTWALAGVVVDPNGTVSLLDNGREVRRIQSRMPVPDNHMMLCNGRCLVQMHGIQLVAENQAVFAVSEGSTHWDVTVKSGRVDFSVRPEAKLVTFRTPHDVLQLEEAVFQAASESLVRGTLVVTEQETRFALHEGTLRVKSRNGSQLVGAGHEIQLAQSQMAPAAGGAGTGAGAAAGAGAGAGTALGMGTGALIATGLSLGAMAAGAAVASDAADGGQEVSPSAPAGLK